MRPYLAAMRRYASFRGRSSRAEFWWFVVVYFVGAIVFTVIDEMLFGPTGDGPGPLTALFVLVHLLPGTAVQIRRLHDIDRTGWWVLIGLTGIGGLVLLRVRLPAWHGRLEPLRCRSICGQPQSNRSCRQGKPGPAPKATPSKTSSVLSRLRAEGHLTDEEFQAMKRKALDNRGHCMND